MLDLILSALSIPESSKKASGISEDPSPKLGKLPLHASQVFAFTTIGAPLLPSKSTDRSFFRQHHVRHVLARPHGLPNPLSSFVVFFALAEDDQRFTLRKGCLHSLA